jgi:hypothetical protein
MTSHRTYQVTRTEAADVIARHTMIGCMRDNTRLTWARIEQEITAWATGSCEGTLGKQWAKLATPSTAFKMAITKLTEMGREDLLPPQLPNAAQRRFLSDLIDAGSVEVSVGDSVSAEIRRIPTDEIVIECRERGWVAPYAGSWTGPYEGNHPCWAPWSITPEGRDAVAKTGAYQRTPRRKG